MQARGALLGAAVAVSLGVTTPASGEEGQVPPVRLAWLDVTGATVGIDGVARAECRSVLERAGLAVAWRKGRGGEEARAGEIRVNVVDRFVVDARARRSIMGAAPARRRAHPGVWIHLGSVQATLGLPPDFPVVDLSLRTRRDLGVALGRVVAHEVVHVLAPSLAHHHGLMAPMLTPAGLTAPRLSLDDRAAERVRAALQGQGGPDEPGPGLLAASGEVDARR